ncbi:hypothetical protein ACQKD9_15675 [Bacillus paramycoides]|uniref:hypothetical protein n=1 Tax=Bacillus paramycoides TaxID=2026194 RepID=UPI003D08EDAE
MKFRARGKEEVIAELIEKDKKNELDYLSNNFEYASKYFTLCKTDRNFPDSSNTVDKFIGKLITERYITRENVGKEWQPSLSENIKICGIKVDGVTVYLKLVESRKTTIPSQDGYGTMQAFRAKYTVAVIHFNNEEPMIELRCSLTEQQKYISYIMSILGFAKPHTDWHTIPKLTKPIVSRLYEILRAGVASRHISLPTSVGSVQFNGKKGVDLNGDQTYTAMLKAFAGLNIPTDDTMDESCYFTYQDPVSGLEYEATVQIDIKNSFFAFNSKVPDFVIKHVMEGIWAVSLGRDGQAAEQIAASN